ncbi:MAG: PD40 domain-containing protein [Chloroflexi bacterium]|nr:PD40 domain-containing protein [Chloroflexota bacterium]
MFFAVLVALVADPSSWHNDLSLQAQDTSSQTDAAVFTLEYYEANRFDQPAVPQAPGIISGPTAPEIIIPWSKIVYQFYQDNNYEIYLTNDDGSGQVRLTNHLAQDIHPRLNRGATKIAFASNRDGDYEIYLMNSNGTGLQQLTFNNTDDVDPVWSPDGARIVFQAYRDNQPEIYIMNGDGSAQMRLTNDNDYDGMPSWSPDGNKIVFTSRRTGGYRIYAMNTGGGGVTPLSGQPYSFHAHYSPDGSKIAYDADENNNGFQEIWLMNADGSQQRSHFGDFVTQQDYLVRSWSPDGRYIAFTNVWFVLYQGNWYWSNAYLEAIAWGAGSEPFSLLYGNSLAWNPHWQTIDNVLPQSHVISLPPYLKTSASQVRWFGSDVGGSGLASYDIQFRTGATWTNWRSAIPVQGDWLTNVPAGSVIFFRSRGRDSGADC